VEERREIIMKKDKKYTSEEIKKAFWAYFHASGELWFNSIGTDKEMEESTDEHWVDFIDELTGGD